MLRTFALLLVLVLPATAKSEEVNMFRVDYEGSYTAWLLHERDGWNLNILASTAGWAEVETGPTFAFGNLLVQPLAGVSFAGSPVQAVSFLPELFVFYADSTVDAGSWTLPAFSKSAKPTLTYREYAVVSGLVPLVGIGAQVEGTLQSGRDAMTYGALLSYNVSPTGKLYGFLGKTREHETFIRFTYTDAPNEFAGSLQKPAFVLLLSLRTRP